jgi:hypothetical protein
MSTSLYFACGAPAGPERRDLLFHFRVKRICRERIASGFRSSINANRRSLRCSGFPVEVGSGHRCLFERSNQVQMSMMADVPTIISAQMNER